MSGVDHGRVQSPELCRRLVDEALQIPGFGHAAPHRDAAEFGGEFQHAFARRQQPELVAVGCELAGDPRADAASGGGDYGDLGHEEVSCKRSVLDAQMIAAVLAIAEASIQSLRRGVRLHSL